MIRTMHFLWRPVNYSLAVVGVMEIRRASKYRIIEVFKMYRGCSSVALQELFEIDTNSKGTRGHSCKLKKVRCTWDIALYFFE